MSEELDEIIYKKILNISKEGESLFERKLFDEALILYNKALNLIPNPKEKWDASFWLFSAIGDSYFFKKEFRHALNAFLDAKNCTTELSNPFINLRLGQCYFELNEFNKAEDCLLRAYMYEGKKIFKSENKKYFEYLKSKFEL